MQVYPYGANFAEAGNTLVEGHDLRGTDEFVKSCQSNNSILIPPADLKALQDEGKPVSNATLSTLKGAV